MNRTIDLSEPDSSPRWWWPVLIWTAIAIVYAAILRVQIPLPLRFSVPNAAVYFYSLALLMIPVKRISARLMSERRPMVTVLLAHAALATAVVAVWQSINLVYHRLVIGPDYWTLVYAGTWMFQLLSALLAYGAALGITLARLAWARERARARREQDLLLAARDAELAALKAQFQPHFVLNALNSVLALIDRDPALARTMVVRLADLMKAVFERVDVDQVPLERELELARAYLDIERIRLGPRLTVTIEVDDAARAVMVPGFLLQPLVENAVKHGVAPYAVNGWVQVHADVSHGRLRVAVRDSGPGPQPSHIPCASAGTGRGLLITRRRLDNTYGSSYSFSLGRDAGGAVADLDLPTKADAA